MSANPTTGLLKVRGVRLLEFADGRITRKDSFWKHVE